MNKTRALVGKPKLHSDRLITAAISVLLLLGGSIYCNQLNANGFQSLQSIRLQAEAYILQYPYQTPYPARFEVSNLDKRLRLKSCPQALTIEFTRRDKTQGNTALNIACQQTPPWKLLLPVRIEIFDDVLVSAKPLLKGQIIDTNHSRFQKHNIARLNNGYFSKNDDLTEFEVRRNLKQGVVLTTANLRPRMMVKSGQHVTLVLDFKGLQIKSSGQALQSARKGETVRVRNNQSQRIVEGIVFGEARVRVKI